MSPAILRRRHTLHAASTSRSLQPPPVLSNPLVYPVHRTALPRRSMQATSSEASRARLPYLAHCVPVSTASVCWSAHTRKHDDDSNRLVDEWTALGSTRCCYSPPRAPQSCPSNQGPNRAHWAPGNQGARLHAPEPGQVRVCAHRSQSHALVSEQFVGASHILKAVREWGS